MIGALSNLWLGDRLGRRKTIVLGGSIMVIGAILQATSFSYAQLVVARIITGLGNGLNVSACVLTRHITANSISITRLLLSLRIMPSVPPQRDGAASL